MSVIKTRFIRSEIKSKISKGMGHNYTVNQRGQMISLHLPNRNFGTFACVIGLSVLEPSGFENQQIRLQLH
jgi:hypothetical protein